MKLKEKKIYIPVGKLQCFQFSHLSLLLLRLLLDFLDLDLDLDLVLDLDLDLDLDLVLIKQINYNRINNFFFSKTQG